MENTQIDDIENQVVEQRKTVDFDTREFTIEFLINKYLDKIDTDENNIFVPEYQRDFVWDDDRQSKLIESIILGLPIPVIFLAECKDGRLEIVDGSQRIRTLAAFFKNELKLTGLERLTKLNEKFYKDISESRQRKIGNIPIRTIVLADTTTEQVKNDLFERINRGSDILREMEKRKGIYKGKFTSFIYECAKNQVLHKLVPLSDSVKNRQEYEELILRFFAFVDMYPNFPTQRQGIGGVLDEYLQDMNEKVKNDDKILKDKKLLFENMLKNVENWFLNGFAKRPGQGVSRVFFEAISVGTYLATINNMTIKLNNKIDSNDLLKDYSFRALVQGKFKTHSPDKIKSRIDYIKNILVS